MAFKTTFRRIEKKFIISEEQYSIIREEFDKYFVPDSYGQTTICNLYYDTPDYLLIRRSIAKPVYKEKLRLRTYGVPNNNQTCFIELKKKYNSVVFKRRISLPLENGMNLLAGNLSETNNAQISREIKYFLSFYENIAPRFFVSYDRNAFFGKDDSEMRVTFDRNLTWRDYDMDLTKGVYGNKLLPDGYILMEIKVPDAIPLWMAKLFSELKIFSTSFSKVGKAYMDMITERSKNNGKVVSKSI